MRKRSSAGPPAGSTGSSPSRLGLGLALPPLLAVLLVALLLLPPDPGLEKASRSLEGVAITDRHGAILHRVPGADGSFMQRIGGEELPETARQVFIRLEDKRFYLHPGVDPAAVARAAAVNLLRGQVVSGASTITMQVARILTPHEWGLRGKIREAVSALRIETRLGKEEILLLYANTLPFGYNVRGVAAAALTYFDRPLAGLSRAQLLLLATIPKAPSRFDPFTAPQQLLRKARSIAPLVGVSPEEVERALRTVRRGRVAAGTPSAAAGAPHFVAWLVRELERGTLAPGVPPGRIVRVVTTLDAGLNAFLRRRIDGEIARAADRSGAVGPTNAAGLVLDNAGGEILAWVGSRDSTQVDGVRARTSSGSTLKPFLYALALERGFTAAALLPDLDLSFGGGESYRPQNFDRRSRGLVRLRTALASSLNVPAVYVASRLGLDAFLDLCDRLGFDLPADASGRYGLGSAVGNLEVSLAGLVRAFSVFPRGGLLPPLRPVREVVTLDGRRLSIPGRGGTSDFVSSGRRLYISPGGDLRPARAYTQAQPPAGMQTPSSRTSTSMSPPAPESGRRIFRAETAWLIRDILSDAAARSSGFGVTSRFNTSFPAMFKSGTASEYTSLWCLGASDDVTIGVWAGNFDGRSAFGATGSSIPARIVVAALEELPRRPGGDRPAGAPPAGLTAVRVCSLTGFLAAPSCPATRLEYFLQERAPRTACPVHDGGMTMEELASRVLLEGDDAPRILFPLDKLVFYRDGRAPEAAQRIRAWIVAPPEERLVARLNGQPVDLAAPFELQLPVRPGRYRLEVSGGTGRDAVSYTVR
jgi:penicillin-binding protein 1C